MAISKGNWQIHRRRQDLLKIGFVGVPGTIVQEYGTYGEEVLQNGRGVGGGHVKFYPYEKGGGRNSLSHAEGGTQTVLG